MRTGRIDSICREILVLDLYRSDSGGRGRFAWFVSGFRLTFIRLAPKCLHFSKLGHACYDPNAAGWDVSDWNCRVTSRGAAIPGLQHRSSQRGCVWLCGQNTG